MQKTNYIEEFKFNCKSLITQFKLIKETARKMYENIDTIITENQIVSNNYKEYKEIIDILKKHLKLEYDEINHKIYTSKFTLDTLSGEITENQKIEIKEL